MKAYVYGARRELPEGFDEFADRGRTAIVSIDMHQGHLADTPDCPCPAPRARDIVAPIDRFHDEARALGIFGVPTFVTRGELFWGDDRLEDAVAWHQDGTLAVPVVSRR